MIPLLYSSYLEPVLEMFHPAFVPNPCSLRIHLLEYIFAFHIQHSLSSVPLSTLPRLFGVVHL